MLIGRLSEVQENTKKRGKIQFRRRFKVCLNAAMTLAILP